MKEVKFLRPSVGKHGSFRTGQTGMISNAKFNALSAEKDAIELVEGPVEELETDWTPDVDEDAFKEELAETATEKKAESRETVVAKPQKKVAGKKKPAKQGK